jgi:hypothetical protein
MTQEYFEDYLLAKFDNVHNEIKELRRLKEHDLASISVRFLDNKEALTPALNNVSDSNKITAMAIEKRFEDVGEFRRNIATESSTFVKRDEFTALISGFGQKIDHVTSRMDQMQGTDHGKETSWGMIVAVVAIIIALGGAVAPYLADSSSPPPQRSDLSRSGSG